MNCSGTGHKPRHTGHWAMLKAPCCVRHHSVYCQTVEGDYLGGSGWGWAYKVEVSLGSLKEVIIFQSIGEIFNM